uniref:NAD(+) diphosphatase n=1 Tax=Herpetomonas muscarum TaxID=5718 RepID=T1YT93_HERMU|nr:NAD+ diphosphatase [Herpetomonas muscarum]
MEKRVAMRNAALLQNFLSFPLAGGHVSRHEKERKREGFLDSRLTAAARPHLVVCQPDGSAGYTSTVFIADGAEPGLAHLLRMAPGTGGPVVDMQKAVYVGEDAASQTNLFITAPDNVQAEALTGGTFVSTRTMIDKLDPQAGAAFGLALSMFNWASSMRFCPGCGGGMRLRDYGMSVQCTACQAPQYPQVSPAMIVCVLDGKGNVLLSQRRRQASFGGAKAIRTILAGFVSHGESMEETVVREVREESGAEVSSLRYVGSQPWPYPHQLMACYYAVAEASPDLVAEEEELLSVGWVPKAEVQRAMADEHTEFCIPPPYSAAHVLLSGWVEGRVNDRGEAQ